MYKSDINIIVFSGNKIEKSSISDGVVKWFTSMGITCSIGSEVRSLMRQQHLLDLSRAGFPVDTPNTFGIRFKVRPCE